MLMKPQMNFFMIFRDFLLTNVINLFLQRVDKIGLHVYISLRTGVAFLSIEIIKE